MRKIISMALAALLAIGNSVAVIAQDENIKNVIIMIPDGGGMVPTYLADEFKMAGGFNEGIFSNATEVEPGHLSYYDLLVGAEVTDSLSGLTDSAAAGTALSSGYKTINSYVGVDSSLVPHVNIMEACQYNGMATGIVSTYEWMHATPAAFSAHAASRTDYANMAEQIVNQDFDVVLGAGFGAAKWGSINEAEIRGYKVLGTMEELQSVKTGDKIWGNFVSTNFPYDVNLPDNVPNLSEMTNAAITALADSEDKGFCLMVEGSQVDSAGHNNDFVASMSEFMAFDAACSVALDFAKKRNDTIVIILPDHDTGGLTIADGADISDEIETLQTGVAPTTEDIVWTTGGHTQRNGGIWMYVPEGTSYPEGLAPVSGDVTQEALDEVFETQIVDNTAIQAYLQNVLGYDYDALTTELFVDVTDMGEYDADDEVFIFNDYDACAKRNASYFCLGDIVYNLEGQVSVYVNGHFYVPQLLLDIVSGDVAGEKNTFIKSKDIWPEENWSVTVYAGDYDAAGNVAKTGSTTIYDPQGNPTVIEGTSLYGVSNSSNASYNLYLPENGKYKITTNSSNPDGGTYVSPIKITVNGIEVNTTIVAGNGVDNVTSEAYITLESGENTIKYEINGAKGGNSAEYLMYLYSFVVEAQNTAEILIEAEEMTPNKSDYVSVEETLGCSNGAYADMYAKTGATTTLTYIINCDEDTAYQLAECVAWDCPANYLSSWSIAVNGTEYFYRDSARSAVEGITKTDTGINTGHSANFIKFETDVIIPFNSGDNTVTVTVYPRTGGGAPYVMSQMDYIKFVEVQDADSLRVEAFGIKNKDATKIDITANPISYSYNVFVPADIEAYFQFYGGADMGHDTSSTYLGKLKFQIDDEDVQTATSDIFTRDSSTINSVNGAQVALYKTKEPISLGAGQHRFTFTCDEKGSAGNNNVVVVMNYFELIPDDSAIDQVVIKSDAQEVRVGETIELFAESKDQYGLQVSDSFIDEVIWSVDDIDIAEISQAGVFTAKKSGVVRANVKVIDTEGNKWSASIPVSVYDNGGIIVIRENVEGGKAVVKFSKAAAAYDETLDAFDVIIRSVDGTILNNVKISKDVVAREGRISKVTAEEMNGDRVDVFVWKSVTDMLPLVAATELKIKQKAPDILIETEAMTPNNVDYISIATGDGYSGKSYVDMYAKTSATTTLTYTINCDEANTYQLAECVAWDCPANYLSAWSISVNGTEYFYRDSARDALAGTTVTDTGLRGTDNFAFYKFETNIEIPFEKGENTIKVTVYPRTGGGAPYVISQMDYLKFVAK